MLRYQFRLERNRDRRMLRSRFFRRCSAVAFQNSPSKNNQANTLADPGGLVPERAIRFASVDRLTNVGLDFELERFERLHILHISKIISTGKSAFDNFDRNDRR